MNFLVRLILFLYEVVAQYSSQIWVQHLLRAIQQNVVPTHCSHYFVCLIFDRPDGRITCFGVGKINCLPAEIRGHQRRHTLTGGKYNQGLIQLQLFYQVLGKKEKGSDSDWESGSY